MGHCVVDALGHLIHGEVRNGAVQWRGANKRMDARLGGLAHGLGAAVDVLEVGTGQTTNHGILGAFCDLAHGLEIAFRGDRKACLDNVDAHIVQQLGNFELFIMGHGGAGALLAITQGGVKNENAILRVHGVGNAGHVRCLSCSDPRGRQALCSGGRVQSLARMHIL